MSAIVTRLSGVRFLGLTCMMCCLSVWSAATATIISNPHFKIDGLVIVWGGAEGSTGKIGTRLVIQQDIPSPALAPLPPVTGELAPISPTGLVALDNAQMHFYAASNTTFSIDAQLLDPTRHTDDALATTRFELNVNLGGGAAEFGQHAQYPHTAGPRGGSPPEQRTLADLVTRMRVFTGNQRTAARTGTIAEQSVRFDMTLTSTEPKQEKTDFSGRPNPVVVFTVFVP